MFYKFLFPVTLMAIAANGADTCKEEYLENVGFIKLGSYKGTTSCGNAYAKTYYISHVFKTHWMHARSICQSYGMEFLSLETLQEQNSFFKLCENKADLFEDWTFIGGYTIEGKSLDKWYWVNSGKRIDYSLTFGHGMPDFGWNQEFCLCLGKQTKTFFMNDALCQGFEKKFICQKEDF